MATFKQDISKPFSRRLNGLCEIQRWWPSFVKNDGVGGLTVDPVLFYTTFNKDLKENIGDGLDDESRTAGIRVEILNTDGTAVSGDPQIEIAGSGTMDARAILTHEDGTKTEFRFIAPSADVKSANVYGSQSKAGAGGMEQGSDASPDMPTKDFSAGPFPVFITLQEFTNWLDGNTNRWDKATVDAQGGIIQDGFYKKAWLPHGLVGDGTIASSSSYPLAHLDPRISTSANDAMPAISKIMATMFMPMLYDNNQLDSTQGSGDSTDIVQGAWDASSGEVGIGNTQTYYNFYDTGMTRYSQQPEDSAKYKWWDDSGDHRKGGYANIQRNDPILNPDNQFDYVNFDISPDSASAANPKWRYRSPLACFLANGIYKLKEGCIIPYVYDEDRTVGGKDGTTVYACWNGKGGIAATQTQLDEAETNMLSSAQIFPLYDFIQGPLCPPAQSWNWDYDVNANWATWIARTSRTRATLIEFNNGTYPADSLDSIHEATMRWQPRSGLVRPNPIRAKIYAAAQIGATGTNTITTSTDAVGVLEVWVEDTTGGFGTLTGPKNVWKVGMPVNMYFGSGVFQEQVNAQGDPTIRRSMGTGTFAIPANPSSGFPAGMQDIRQFAFPPASPVDLQRGTTNPAFSGRSGWWICNKVETLTAVNKSTIVSGATGTFNGHKLSFVINGSNRQNSDYLDTHIAYETQKSWICQGIMGGAEMGFGGQFDYGAGTGTSPDRALWAFTSLNTAGTAPFNPPSGALAGTGTRYGIGSNKGLGMNRYNIIPVGGNGINLMNHYGADIGLGFYGGICGATNVPAYANTQWRFPTAVCFDPEPFFFAEFGGFVEARDIAAPKGITLRSGEDDPFLSVPTANSFSGNILRMAAPQTAGHANFYASISDPTTIGSGNMIIAGDFCLRTGVEYEPLGTNPTGYNQNQFVNHGNARWIQKSLVMLMQSAYDQSSGKNSFDYIIPSLLTNGRNSVWPVHERVGTKWGYGNFIEFPDSWLEANKDKVYDPRYFKGETTATSLTEVGCSPVWLDMELSAWIPMRKERLVFIEFDTGVPETSFGKHTHSISVDDGGALRTARNGGFVFETTGGGHSLWDSWESAGRQKNSSLHGWNTNLWFFQGSDVMANTAFDAATSGGWTGWASWPFAGQGNTGFGQMGNQIGTGTTPFTISEGYHNIRTVFDEEGMTLVIDGQNKGKDLNSNNPVWGFSIVAANLTMGMPLHALNLPLQTASNTNFWFGGEAVAKDDADLQIDSIRLRHIPTPAMLPFTVDTVNQKITGVSKYTALTVEAENISISKGMNIKVSICPVVDNNPAPSTGITLRQVEGGTPYENFDNLSLDFVGGFGSIDLSLLPADAITNGFVIRFNFYVPSSSDTELHPVDWSKTPIIRSWSLEHDLAPTSTLSVIGNTFNGDITPPIDTKVGHIISFNAAGTTTDEDRVLTHFKFDFGDGVITEFLPLSDQTQTSATFNTAHSYLTSGTYQATCTVKDDAGNEGVSSQVQIVVANAPPVAVLKSIPSLTRAGTAITLDGTDSFDINAGGSISNYTFTFGDGSNAVSGSAGTVQHTYAHAGEYQATLVCTDAGGATSQTASAVIKVLPATLVIPLVFNVKPAAFARTRGATMNQTQVLDATYPELTDTGQRTDEMQLTGMFLHSTANADIAFVEECMLAGSLVEFLYEDVDYDGVPSGKSFVGRITAFDYDREGALDGQTPYSITLVREAGLGV